jgi:hypothetical protein
VTIRSFFADLLAFLRSWSDWRKRMPELEPKPDFAEAKANYASARKAHHGQREAWLKLRDAANESLKRGLYS